MVGWRLAKEVGQSDKEGGSEGGEWKRGREVSLFARLTPHTAGNRTA